MLNFNIKEYVKTVLPPGEYTLRIKKSQLKPSKNNPEIYHLNVIFEVISDFRRGAILSENFNIYHPNETAQRIGRENLASLASAAGVLDLKNIEELEKCIIEATVKEDFYKENKINRVEKYRVSIRKGVTNEDINQLYDESNAEFTDKIPF